jgi:hypothetical protein
MKKLIFIFILGFVTSAHAAQKTVDVKSISEISEGYIQFESTDGKAVSIKCSSAGFGLIGQLDIFIDNSLEVMMRHSVITASTGYCQHVLYNFADAIIAGSKASVTYDQDSQKISLNTSTK